MNLRLYLIFCILSLCICSCNTRVERVFESGTWNFEECASITDFALYKDYLIFIDQENQGTKFTVINYLTNEIDIDLQNSFYKIGISKLHVENDSLYAYSVIGKNWFVWNNSKWTIGTPFKDSFKANFEKSYLAEDCYSVFDDEQYYVYGYNRGEFGSGVIFLDKMDGRLYGYVSITPSSVFKDSLGYVISCNSNLYRKMAVVIRIKNPGLLPAIPVDYLIFKDKMGFMNYLYKQSLQTLPDSIQLKFRQVSDKIDRFNRRQDPDFKKRQILEMECDSLYKLNDNIDYLFDNSHWYDDDKTLCFSSYLYKNQLLHTLKSEDGCLYTAQLADGKVKMIQDTIMCQLSSHCAAFSRQFSDKSLILVDYDWSSDKCKRMTAFIIDNEHIKRYNFGF